MNLDEMKAEVESWMAGWKYGHDRHLWEESVDNNRACLRLFTSECVYAISVHAESSYLGCIVSARKACPGETWTRGNDLHDGPFSRETWTRILEDIVGYELEEISSVKLPPLLQKAG